MQNPPQSVKSVLLWNSKLRTQKSQVGRQSYTLFLFHCQSIRGLVDDFLETFRHILHLIQVCWMALQRLITGSATFRGRHSTLKQSSRLFTATVQDRQVAHHTTFILGFMGDTGIGGCMAIGCCTLSYLRQALGYRQAGHKVSKGEHTHTSANDST